MKMYKGEKKEKKILFLAGVLVLAATLVVSVTVLAGNEATQSASSAKATTITVVGKVADTAITTITFPEGAPGATVSVPYNNVDLAADPQVLSTTSSEPVVRLKNTAGVNYNAWLGITTWTNGIAASQDYELVATTATGTNAVAIVLSSNGNANSTSTGVTIDAGTYKALYLELNLSNVASKTGTSTLSVLGETS